VRTAGHPREGFQRQVSNSCLAQGC
jgi:hypothetical protein